MKKLLLILLCLPIIGFGQSAFISGNDTICSNDVNSAEVSISFNGTPPYTFVYAIDGIPQAPYTVTTNPYIIQSNEAGIYTVVSFSDANGVGVINGTALVTVISAPVALFSASPDTIPTTFPQVQFTDQSIGNIISWSWQFGDGGGSSNQNPSYWYDIIPHLYQVTLVITDDIGCTDTASKIIYVVEEFQTSIQEHTINKELLKITDILGRETKGKKNQPLFYIYDDGTVEKRITTE